MTPSQTRALDGVRQLIFRAAFLDLDGITDAGTRRRITEEEAARSKYEFQTWEVRENGRGALYVFARVRLRTPQTVGNLFPRTYHCAIGPRGAVRELGFGLRGRRVGLRDYLRGRN